MSEVPLYQRALEGYLTHKNTPLSEGHQRALVTAHAQQCRAKT